MNRKHCLSAAVILLLSHATPAAAVDCAAYLEQQKQLNAAAQDLIRKGIDDNVNLDSASCQFRTEEWSIRDEKHQAWCAGKDASAVQQRLAAMSAELRACGADLDEHRRTAATTQTDQTDRSTQVTRDETRPPAPLTQRLPDPQEAAGPIGCFKDTSDFDLNGYLERSLQNTPQRCIAICKDRGFAYAGVQYGESCLCGNSYGRYGPVGIEACNYVCPGDPWQMCGGYSTNMVYRTSSSP